MDVLGRAKQFFLLVKYGFWNNKALQSANLSFIMFAFLTSLVIVSNEISSSVFLIKTFLTKNEDLTFLHEFTLVLIMYIIRAIPLKKCQKWGVWRKYKKGFSHIRGLYIEGEFKPSAHYAGIKYFDFVGSKGTILFLETRLNPINKLQSSLSKVVGNAIWRNSLDNI